jgi:hypothetical protein
LSMNSAWRAMAALRLPLARYSVTRAGGRSALRGPSLRCLQLTQHGTVQRRVESLGRTRGLLIQRELCRSCWGGKQVQRPLWRAKTTSSSSQPTSAATVLPLHAHTHLLAICIVTLTASMPCPGPRPCLTASIAASRGGSTSPYTQTMLGWRTLPSRLASFSSSETLSCSYRTARTGSGVVGHSPHASELWAAAARGPLVSLGRLDEGASQALFASKPAVRRFSAPHLADTAHPAIRHQQAGVEALDLSSNTNSHTVTQKGRPPTL